MILVTFHGYYDIFGKIETIRFSIIGMVILRKFLELRKWRVKFGLKLNLQFQKEKL